jgi:predicted dinucleotide-binding enzyme
MRIGIIGSGKVGRALGAWLAKAGFPPVFASRTHMHAIEAAHLAGYGARAATIAELVQESDVIFLTLPFGEIDNALETVRDELSGKTLVDVTNPISPDHRSLTIGHTNSGAEEISRQFPAASVVKAFNAVFAEVYAAQKPEIDGRAITIFFAGDNPKAKASVRELIAALGFDAADAGPLGNSRYLEPLSLLNIHLGRVLGFGVQIGLSLLRTTDSLFEEGVRS